MNTISNSDDVIDSCDVIARIEELLEALDRLTWMVDAAEKLNDSVAAGNVCRDALSFADFRAARAAIAKAKGAE